MSAPMHLSAQPDGSTATAARQLPLPVHAPVALPLPPLPVPPHAHSHAPVHASAPLPPAAAPRSYHPHAPLAMLPPLAVPVVAHAHPHAHPHAHTAAAANYYELYIGALEHARRLQAAVDALRADNDALRQRVASLQRPEAAAPKTQSRYWTPDEHQRFLDALQEYGPKDVRAIATYVGTRNATQVRTHAQKYWIRVQREEARRGGKHSLANARRRCLSESDLAKVERESSATPPSSAAALPASPPKSRFPLPKPGRSPLAKKPFGLMDIVSSSSPSASSAMKPPLALGKLDLDRPLPLPLPRPPASAGAGADPPPPAKRPPLPTDTDDCHAGIKLLSMVAESSRAPMER